MKSSIKVKDHIKQSDIVFLTLVNETDTGVLSQHAMRMRVDGEIGYYGQLYGNTSLCNKVMASMGTGKGEGDLEHFDHEKQSPHLCKNCLKVYNTLKP